MRRWKLARPLGAALLAAALGAAPAGAQAGDPWEDLAVVAFEASTLREGLPHDAVAALAQDATGFLWVGTMGGLARYDGYRFRQYLNDPADPGSLADNYVRSLVAGGDGRLWIGTNNGGVSVYDPATDRFTAARIGAEGVGHPKIYSLAPDGAGGVWAGTHAGLDRLGPDLRPVQRFRSGDPAGGLKGETVFALLRDGRGMLWAGTERGLFRLPPGGERFEPVAAADAAAREVVTGGIWSLHEDGEGDVWVGSERTGIALISRRDGLARAVPGLSGTASALRQHVVRGIAEVRPGELWLATYGGGVLVLDRATGATRRLEHDPAVPASLNGNLLRAVLRDRSGLVWIGTQRGLERNNPSNQGILTVSLADRGGRFSGTDVWSLAAAPDGRVWLGLESGRVDRIDLRDGSVRRPTAQDPPPPAREVQRLLRRPDGTLLAGSIGIHAVDPETLAMRPAPPGNAVGRDVIGLYDSGDATWVGTYFGVVRQDRATGRETLFRHDPEDPSSLSDNQVRAVLRDHEGRTWIGTALGLNVMLPGETAMHRFRHVPGEPGALPHDYVNSLALDGRGRLWVGTVSGLSLMEPGWRPGRPAAFTTLKRAQGLPSDYIGAILPIPAPAGRPGGGALWISTADGLATVDTETRQVRRFGRADGLRISNYINASAASLPDGTLLFGGFGGLTVVRPDRLSEPDQPAQLVLTRIRGAAASSVPATIAADHGAMVLRVPPEDRRLEAEFALLNFAAADAVRYAYRLEGFDAGWIDAEPARRVAVYTNLPAGDYTLRVRAQVGDDGQVRELALPVEVVPLWHETGWARLAGALVLLAAVALLVQARTALLRRRQRALQEEVEARTRDLTDANDRLHHLATHDALTGLVNRRRFLELLAVEQERAVRYGGTFSVVMIDLDHFKRVNDGHGHAAGDTVLREAAGRLQSALRGTDVAARYGGEELAVLLPMTEGQAALVAAQRFHMLMRGTPIRHAGETLLVTASAGVAEWLGPHEAGEWTLERADKALYAAKQSGRDRVVLAAAEREPEPVAG
ncbi:MAG TPA: diguanylate cyclase [Azospirillaceae bacterium]|nr:diguanylate cyclase [Azospirillaceae bacterium]